MIRLNNLSMSFGKNKVLNDISLTFESGKVYGIVGANGSGKTTLFRSIAGLENHDGEVAYEWTPLKNHLGFLETNPIVMTRITGWEYLKLLCVSRGIHEENFENQNIFDLPLQQYADTYSTGMKKKLALLAILLQNNKVYILDEPFNGVDIQSNLMIIALIKKLKALDKIILISSHIFSTLSDTCDIIHLLAAGQIEKTVDRNDFRSLDEVMQTFISVDKINHLKLS